MAKRFTDTDKWKRPWFKQLPLLARMTWIYILDDCDNAGIWIADFRLLSFQIGEPVTKDQFDGWFGEKVIPLDSDKYHIPTFIEFQYGELRDNNPAHRSVIDKLKRKGINVEFKSGYSDRPSAVLSRLSEKKKLEILASEFYRCSYCGASGDSHSLVVDHIKPRNAGGDNSDDNLTSACHSCNGKKTDMDVARFLEKNGLGEKISSTLKHKISILSTLNAPNKTLEGAKDKDKEKDKDKDKDKDISFKEEDEKNVVVAAPRRDASLSVDTQALVLVWGETLKHFGVLKDANLDRVSIASLIQRYGTEQTRMALVGARHEPSSDTFHPKEHISIFRVARAETFNKLVNLGSKHVLVPKPEEQSEVKRRWAEIEREKQERAAGWN